MSPGYYLSEDAHREIERVRDSLQLLEDCTNCVKPAPVMPELLSNHLNLLIQHLNSAMQQAEFISLEGVSHE